MLFCRGGYGVHSPFVFELMTEVIEERKLYYCYDRLRPVRLQILQRRDGVMYGNRKVSIRKLLDKYGFTEHEHRFLFRLANRFQVKTILAVGSDFGLTPLYLTAYSTDSSCVAIEPEPSMAAVAKEYINKYATASIDLRGDYTEIPDGLDLVVFGVSIPAFKLFLPHIHEKSAMVIQGINESIRNRKAWKEICAHPKVTVTIDMYRLGIVFFNPDLHRRTYKSIVL